MSERAILGMTFHFLRGTEIVSIDIAIKQLKQRHTAQYLGETMMSILDLGEWNIEPEKILSVVTDDGANMIAAVQLKESTRHC